MTPVVSITRLHSGGAVAELSGDAQVWPDWRTAAEDASKRGLAWNLQPPSPTEPRAAASTEATA